MQLEEVGREAEEWMNLEVVTVPPELPLQTAHRLMMDRALRHLPVVSGQKLAGILSEREVLLASSRARDGSYVYPKLTVGDVMSLAPIAAGPGVSVAELARTMVEARLEAIPILLSNNVLVGLVTSTDLLRSLARLPRDAEPALRFHIRRAAELQAVHA